MTIVRLGDGRLVVFSAIALDEDEMAALEAFGRPWPNRDLNVGAIIALSPALSATEKAVFNSWGRGMYDPRHNIDGQNKPVVIPPAYGLAGIHKITFTGDGDEIAYWNSYVAVTQMGGLGTFSDPRLPLTIINGTVDLVSDKLPALQAYQLSLGAPAAPAGSFDAVAGVRGKLVFEGKGQCASCHAGRRSHRLQQQACPRSCCAGDRGPGAIPEVVVSRTLCIRSEPSRPNVIFRKATETQCEQGNGLP